MATRSQSPAVASGEQRRHRGLFGKVANLLKDPDIFFQRQGLSLRRAWWRALHLWHFQEVARRRRLAGELPLSSALTPIDPAIGAGFSTSPAVLALTADAVRAALDYAGSFDLEQAAVDNVGMKSYLVQLARQRPIPADSPIYDLALHPQILGTVARYFGYLPVLTCVDVWYSPVSDGNEPYIGSQLYHLDKEDIQQIKVFIYLHEIDVSHSPTMYISKDRSLALCRQHYDNMLRDSVRIDEELLKDETITYHTGPTGSVCMLDTSACLHAGGRCKKDRKLLIFQYMTPFSHVRNRAKLQRFDFLRKPEMSAVDRAVLNLD